MTVMKSLRLGLLLILSGISIVTAETRLTEAHQVRVGHTLLIKAPGVERVAFGDGEIAEVEVIEETEEILIIGRRTGRSDLRIWTASDTQHLDIQVIAQQPLTAEAPETPPAQTVRVQARFVELKRSTLRQIGMNWASQSPGITFAYASDFYTNDVFRGGFGDFLPADSLPLDIGGGNQYLGLGVSLSSMIDLLGESGEARVIAEPMLSTLSGSSAEFQAGGEVPIPVQGTDGTTSVTFKDYGILLKVAPEITSNNLIRTQVEIEVSDVDESVSVLGVPGFSVRNAMTEMNAQSGETLLIAGLIDEQQSSVIRQIPGLGDLPVIGELFRSRRFQDEQTELVVLITPTATAQVVTDPSGIDADNASTLMPSSLRGEPGRPLPLREGW